MSKSVSFDMVMNALEEDRDQSGDENDENEDGEENEELTIIEAVSYTHLTLPTICSV